MNINFNFAEGVNGETIIGATQYIAQFVDMSLLDRQVVHPISEISVYSNVSGHFAVSVTDDAGAYTPSEHFYYDPSAEQWLPMSDHPLVKAQVLEVGHD